MLLLMRLVATPLNSSSRVNYTLVLKYSSCSENSLYFRLEFRPEYLVVEFCFNAWSSPFFSDLICSFF